MKALISFQIVGLLSAVFMQLEGCKPPELPFGNAPIVFRNTLDTCPHPAAEGLDNADCIISCAKKFAVGAPEYDSCVADCSPVGRT